MKNEKGEKMGNIKYTKKTEEIVDKLRPIDDVFFTKLAENIEFCQEILQIILEMPELQVVETLPQKQLRNIKGRSVIVDVLCKDAKGQYFNIEVQKENEDDHQRRVRYNGSNVDTYIAEKGITFEELPDVYIVYISQFDYFKQGKTIYHIDRVIRETQQVVDNGYYEIYVNTKVDDGTDIAGLMKLFTSSTVEEDERYPATCRTVKELKVGKGREHMCTLVEEYAEERAREAREEARKAKEETEKLREEAEKVKEEAEKVREEAEKAREEARATVISLIKAGISNEIIKNAAKLSDEEIEKLRSEI